MEPLSEVRMDGIIIELVKIVMGAIPTLIAAIYGMRKMNQKNKTVYQLLLRSEILSSVARLMKNDHISADEIASVEQMFNVYKENGGNGATEKRVNKLMDHYANLEGEEE